MRVLDFDHQRSASICTVVSVALPAPPTRASRQEWKTGGTRLSNTEKFSSDMGEDALTQQTGTLELPKLSILTVSTKDELCD